VRPSPSKGSLGGISTYTHDAVTLCEAAGYDLILVESVGVGQSEIEISHCVDMAILLIPPGGGDSLQGKHHE
jgi:LAO/AO transport system kinase